MILELILWMIEVTFFVTIVVALLSDPALPWWGLLGFAGAFIVLAVLVWINLRYWSGPPPALFNNGS
jgi:hypothetical protein